VRQARCALLVDLSGVLTASPLDALRALAPDAGMSPDAFVALVVGDAGTDSDHPYHRLERGQIGLDEYLDELVTLAGSRGIELDFEHLAGSFSPPDVHWDVVEAIRSLRSDGFAAALVTNAVPEATERFAHRIPVDELFDIVVASCRVGVRKPDPRIFAVALHRLGDIPPQRAVLVDDEEANVDAALRMGIRAVHFTRPSQGLAELAALTAAVLRTEVAQETPGL